MIICKSCGTQSPDGTIVCPKCGIAFMRQYQASADQKRAQTGLIIRTIGWVCLLVIAIVAGPKVYHIGRTAYLKHHLTSITEGATRACDGPVTDMMGPDQKAKFEQCMEGNSDLNEAKKDYADITKGE